MPNLDGYCATKLIRRFEIEKTLEKGAFIIVVSGNFSKPKGENQVDGADLYISKPYSLSDIKNGLGEYLKKDNIVEKEIIVEQSIEKTNTEGSKSLMTQYRRHFGGSCIRKILVVVLLFFICHFFFIWMIVSKK